MRGRGDGRTLMGFLATASLGRGRTGGRADGRTGGPWSDRMMRATTQTELSSRAQRGIYSAVCGFTLVELLVVLVVLGVVAGVSAGALPSLLRQPADPTLATRLLSARREAVLGGREVTVVVSDHRTGSPRRWRFYPDGRALGPGLDPRNGAIVDSNFATEPLP